MENQVLIIILVCCIAVLAAILAIVTAKLQAVKKKNKAVLEANQMKVDFVQTIGHDLRTPLNAVVGFSQLLALPSDFLTQEEKDNYAQFIAANAQLLTTLIDDVMTAGICSQTMSFHYSDTDINYIGRQAVLTCQHRCNPGVEMSFTTDIPDGTTIVSDPNRCLQVLINLLSNATKHTAEGSIVLHASDREKDGMLTYSVTDTGTGIPPELHEVIFQRYVKLDSGKQGSGLGLAICSQIAQALHGDVSLDSSHVGGARFIFNVPLNQDAR